MVSRMNAVGMPHRNNWKYVHNNTQTPVDYLRCLAVRRSQVRGRENTGKPCGMMCQIHWTTQQRRTLVEANPTHELVEKVCLCVEETDGWRRVVGRVQGDIGLDI